MSSDSTAADTAPAGPSPKITCIAVTYPLPPSALTTVRSRFPTVHFYPHPSPIPSSVLPDIQVLYTSNRGIAPETGIASFDQMPKLRHIQMVSAGADKAANQSIMATAAERGVTLGSASGIHVLSIPPWVVGMAVGVWQQFPRMMQIQRNEQRWADGTEVEQSSQELYYARSLRGRTAGMLGYGALGRESARLLKAMGMKIIACNTSRKQTPQDGYIIPGTGDPTGSLPSSFYSTRDSTSLDAFLSECDLLVASLPGTQGTRYLLDAAKLGLMKDEAVFVNVGRGSLIKSEELLKALDSPRLFGAALDVTDPEPLPTGHPLWSHPKCIITPHLSGDTEGQFDIATDILLENVRRMEAGEGLVNLIDIKRGY